MSPARFLGMRFVPTVYESKSPFVSSACKLENLDFLPPSQGFGWYKTGNRDILTTKHTKITKENIDLFSLFRKLKMLGYALAVRLRLILICLLSTHIERVFITR